MRKRVFIPVVFACLGGALNVSTAADDKIEFFRRFLDESPAVSAESSNLAQDWLREVAQAAPAKSAKPFSSRASNRQPVLVAVRAEPIVKAAKRRATQPVAKPAPEPAVPQPTQHPNAYPITQMAAPTAPVAPAGSLKPIAVLPPTDVAPAPAVTPNAEVTAAALPVDSEGPAARLAARPLRTIMQQPKPPLQQPEPPTTTGTPQVDAAEVTAEVKQIEASVKQRVATLQQRLEAEESRLEAKLAAFGTRREAALAKSDEEALKQIEKAEQGAVASYEQRVQRLLNAAMPATGASPVASHNGSDSAPRATERETEKPGARRFPSQPVERPVATKRSATQARPAWAKQPRTTSSKVQPKYRTTPTKQRSANTVAEQKQKQKLLLQQRQKQPAPAKKRFRLWPFR